MGNQPLFVLRGWHSIHVISCKSILVWVKKVRKKAKIRNQCNQVPHLTQDTLWECDKSTRKQHLQKRLEVSPFPAGEQGCKPQTRQYVKDKQKKYAKGFRGIPLRVCKNACAYNSAWPYSFLSYLLWFLEEKILIIVLTLCPLRIFNAVGFFQNQLFSKKS